MQAAEYRQQAFAWLSDDLQSWQQSEQATVAWKQEARRALNRWQLAPEFDSVSLGAQLLELPDIERGQWSTLWQEVRRLLK